MSKVADIDECLVAAGCVTPDGHPQEKDSRKEKKESPSDWTTKQTLYKKTSRRDQRKRVLQNTNGTFEVRLHCIKDRHQ